MIVYSADGGKLGRINVCRPDGFIVEKGLFFPKASMFRYEDVADVRDGDVYLRHAQRELADESAWTTHEEVTEGIAVKKPSAGEKLESAKVGVASAVSRAEEAVRGKMRQPSEEARERTTEPAPKTTLGTQEDIRIPLAEEEVLTETHVADLGEVRIHKRVVVRQQQISVPVMHEEVRVERVKVDPTATNTLAKDIFEERVMSIPLHEEEVEIKKRPVVREEVRVRKFALKEDRVATTDLRREELDIQEPESLKRFRRSA